MASPNRRFKRPARELIIAFKASSPGSGDQLAPQGELARVLEIVAAGAGRLRLIRRDPAARATRPGHEFHRVVADDDRLEELRARLAAHPAVEAAYIKPGATPSVILMKDAAILPVIAPAPVGPATPDFTPRQLYLNSAPGGIGAAAIWAMPGGRGAGVTIIDCEWSWNFTHEDIQNYCSGAMIGAPTDPDNDHGTAVIGTLIAGANGFGTTGIASDCRLGGAVLPNDNSDDGTASIIATAATRLGAGDLLLLELHRPGPNARPQPPDGQQGFVAVEWWPDDFQAISDATAKGILVVEAGGNGQENLDDGAYNNPQVGFPASWSNPFALGGRQSGAIIVGAGNPPAGTHGRTQDTFGYNEVFVDRARCGFSNFGSRVDCQGWGWEVTSTGYGQLQGGNPNQYYTDTFAGTSSASPIVAGTLACVQGALKARGLALLTPASAQALLRGTGSAQLDAPGRPATDRIGNRPDLNQIMAALGL